MRREGLSINVVIVIPALNPTGKLIRLVHDIFSLFSPHIIVIDDGSDESCAKVFEALKPMGCEVITHERNLGKGAALKTGFRRALAEHPDMYGVVTADCDGQHLPQDIFKLARRLREGAEGIVLGERNFDSKRAPRRSRWGNKITAFVFELKTDIKLRDTQTGLRAIPRPYLPALIKTRGSRYEYEMDMLLYAYEMDIPIITLPVETVYSERDRSSHFHAVRDSARIYLDLLKFSCSSGICAIVDLGLFILLSSLVFGHSHFEIVICAMLARIVSGTGNFLINRFIVFKHKSKTAPAKYLALFIIQMFLSSQLTALLSLTVLSPTVSKIIVDTLLFILNYNVQRKFIFKRRRAGNGKASE